ncbi:hypothetical protein [Couchioplanes caeruleus]|uniref:PLAT domain-containing protein n=2 Tax=Couchioplanes caeruleus TaxID=56438 RepID=A0A1K0FH94_9ACTN|nr:hypothetical protein [Couchioplanes caeruleus]OJF12104.1 hypothetical protein BG844_22435 [Couchioplanes caeruleus subsp. caeruleus]ROP29057.1 hypothetical protein EDD30_1841 [Couchioplanes caeruleus]
MAMQSVRALKRAITGVTAALLVTAGFAATASPAQAGRIGACAEMRAFTLTLGSGGDDLRHNSEVVVWLTGTPGGDTELQHVWGGIPNWSNRTYSISYQNTNWHVNSCSVTGIRVRMISHNGTFETNDNWNMQSITLHGFSDGGAPAYAISANGDPVKRFTGSAPEWTRRG